MTINGTTYENLFFARDYELTLVEGTLLVEKARLAVEATQTRGSFGGNEPDYGWQLSAAQERYDCDGLAKWDIKDSVFATKPVVTLDTDAAGGSYAELAVGRYREVLMPHDGSSANYELVYLPGDIVVDKADLGDTARFAVTAEDTTYNGDPQNQSVSVVDNDRGGALLEEGVDYTLAYPANTTDAGELFVTVTGAGNYTGTRQANYVINKAPVTVTTEGAIKPYDGTPLTAEGTLEGLVANETATLVTTGSQTKVGSSTNGYRIDWNGTAEQGNYRVEEQLGTLTITANQAPVTLTAPSASKTYDGAPLVAEGSVEVSGLPAGYTVRATVSGSQTDVGTSVSTVDDGYAILASDGSDQTESFAKVLRVDGSLTVIPATLVVRTPSASKPYDGTPLTAEGNVEGLVGEQTVSFVVTGSQTEVGSSQNTYVLTWDGTAKQANYQIQDDLGILTVTNPDPGPDPTPEQISYRYAGPANQAWTKGTTAQLSFTFKRSTQDEQTFAHFTGITVDGIELSASSYEARAGSVIITLPAAYLETLKVGSHTLAASFDDGNTPEASFSVREKDSGGVTPATPTVTPSSPAASGASTHVTTAELPKTGDAANPWSAVLALVGITLLAFALTDRLLPTRAPGRQGVPRDW